MITQTNVAVEVVNFRLPIARLALSAKGAVPKSRLPVGGRLPAPTAAGTVLAGEKPLASRAGLSRQWGRLMYV